MALRFGLAGAAIAGGLAVAVNSAANFEQRLSAIKAVSGATAGEMDLISEAALRIGAETSFSATEAASAIEELAKAGVSTEDILNGAADAAVSLAAAGEVDLATAASIASNALNTFNLTGADMTHVADLMAGAASASAIGVEDLGMSLSQAGAVAALAGLSLDETTVAIAELGNAGIKGSDAGTSLKTFLQNLQPVTDKQTQLFKELGLTLDDGTNAFYDATGSLKPFNEIQQTLSDSLAGMTDAQKSATLETLFGTDAIRAAAVFANEGATGYDAMWAAMGETTAAEQAATRLDNFKGSLEQVKGSIETLLIGLGQQLLPVLQNIAESVAGLINWFSGLSDSTKNLAVGVAASVAAGLLMLALILKLVSGAKALRVAMIALNLAFKANPVLIIVAALVVLATMFATLWATSETFRNIVKGVIEAVRNAIVTAWDAVVAAFRNVIDWIEKNKTALISVASVVTAILLPTLLRLAAQAATTAAKVVAGWVLQSGGAVKSAALQLVSGVKIVASWVAQSVAATVNGAKIAAQWVIQQLAAYKTAAIYVAQGVKMAAMWVAQGVRAVATAVIVVAQWLLMGISALAAGAQMALAWIIGLGPIGLLIAGIALVIAAFVFFKDEIVAGAQYVWEKVSGFFTMIWEWIVGIFQNIGQWFADRWNELIGTVSVVVDGISGWFSDAWDKITAIWDGAVGFFQGIWDAITGIFSSGTDELAAHVAQVAADAMNSALPAITQAAEAAGKTIPGWIADGIQANEVAAIQAAGGLMAAIDIQMGDPNGERRGVGGEIVGSLVEGMNAALPAAITAATAAGQVVPTWIANGITYTEALAIQAAGGLTAAINAQLPEPAPAIDSGSGWSGGIGVGINFRRAEAIGAAVNVKAGVNASLPKYSEGYSSGNLLGSGLKVGIDSAQSSVKAAASGLAVAVTSGLPGYNDGYGPGKNVALGVKAGIDDGAPAAKQAAASLAASVSSTLNVDLKVHSPSRITFETGKQVVQGLLRGMLGEQGSLERAASLIAASARPVFAGGVIDSTFTQGAASAPVAGATTTVQVDVNAPQSMSPDQVGTAVASKVGYALGGNTSLIPLPLERVG